MCTGMRRPVIVAGNPHIMGAVPIVIPGNPHIAPIRRGARVLDYWGGWSYANDNLRE
jgi:hypothetical protein